MKDADDWLGNRGWRRDSWILELACCLVRASYFDVRVGWFGHQTLSSAYEGAGLNMNLLKWSLQSRSSWTNFVRWSSHDSVRLLNRLDLSKGPVSWRVFWFVAGRTCWHVSWLNVICWRLCVLEQVLAFAKSLNLAADTIGWALESTWFNNKKLKITSKMGWFKRVQSCKGIYIPNPKGNYRSSNFW